MPNENLILNDLIDRLKSRLFRAFNEFEVNDDNCYKHFWETRNSLESYSYEFRELEKTAQYHIILGNIDIMIDASISMSEEYSLIRNLFFDTMTLLDRLKG